MRSKRVALTLQLSRLLGGSRYKTMYLIKSCEWQTHPGGLMYSTSHHFPDPALTGLLSPLLHHTIMISTLPIWLIYPSSSYMDPMTIMFPSATAERTSPSLMHGRAYRTV